MNEQPEYGEWVKWGLPRKPVALQDNQRMQACFINSSGDLMIDGVSSLRDRAVVSHRWDGCDGITLAYRLQVN